MSHQRYNQRHPHAPPSPARNSATDRAELNPLAVPARVGGGRIFPSNPDIVPISIPVQNSRKKPNKPITDVKFEKACKGFFEATIRLQIIACSFFFVLMFTTQVTQDNFSTAIGVYFGFTCVYVFIRLVMIVFGADDIYGRLVMAYKFVEAVVWVMFVGSNDLINIRLPGVPLFSTLLVSYLIRMIYSYMINRFEQSKFGNSMAKIVLLLRILILIQLVLVLVQLRLTKQITWFAVVIPAWIIFVIIIIFTITLFRRVYFVYAFELWESSKKMTKVALWIFGNLFILACLVLSISILVALVYDGYISESSRPFLVPFIVIAVWYPISLLCSYRMQDEISKVMQEIGVTLDGTKMEKEDHKIKYVIKMSNTYFKPVKKKEVKEYKKWKKSIFKCWKKRPEIKAGLKRMPTESGKCMVCYINISDGVLMGCGHGGICFECGEDLLKARKGCHLCREKIKSLLKIKMNTKNTNDMYYKVKQEIRSWTEQ